MTLPEQAWEVAARSETGYVRGENQDRMSGARVKLGEVYIVADGMGGHKGGALAAELTVRGIQQRLSEVTTDTPVDDAIRTSFEETNKNVFEKAHSGNPETQGMGSTAVLLLASGSAIRVAHVGDSRAYLYRKRRLKRLTMDHTQVQRMVDARMLTPEEARTHPDVSVLDRAIGTRPEVEVDISAELPVKSGDAILLCSDGLCGYVEDSEIEAVLRSRTTVQEVPDGLVKLALEKGGEDNVTLQFVQYGKRTEAPRGRGKRATKELPVATAAEGPATQDRRQKRSARLRQFVSGAVMGILVLAGLLYVYVDRVKDQAVEQKNQAQQEELASLQGTLGAREEKIQELETKLADLNEKAEEHQTAALKNVTQLRNELAWVRKQLKQTDQALKQAGDKLTEKGGELENLRQRDDKAQADLKDALKKEKKGLKVLYVMRTANEQPPEKRPLPALVRQVERIEILIIRPDEFGTSDAVKDSLPKEAGIYYSKALSAEKEMAIKKLAKILGVSDVSKYSGEQQALQAYIEKEYPSTGGHVLVIFSDAKD